MFSPSLLTLALVQTPPVAPPDLDAAIGELSRLQSQFLSNILPWVLVSQLILIVSNWIASKIFAYEEGRFINAIKLWILNWLAVIGIVMAGFIFFALYFNSGGHWNILLEFEAGGIIVLLSLIFFFGLITKIYKIGFFGAFFFIVVTGILNVAGNIAVTHFMPSQVDWEDIRHLDEQYLRLSPSDRKTLSMRLIGVTEKNSVDESLAADRSKSISERHAAIQRIYGKLEIRRIALKSNDSIALSTYSRDKERYQKLLTKLQADAAAAAMQTKSN